MKTAEDGALAGRRVLLGVTGGIASYKSVWVARLLTQSEAQVDVVMSRAASEFVGAITFEAVTGRTVWTHLLAAGHALDHIRLAREADAVVVAPATADFLAKAAHGLADDLLTATLLATSAPVLLVPAMNDRMWAHQQTSSNVARVRELGYTVLDPDTGPLAAGEGSGPGRMPEPERIVAHVRRMLRARAGGAVAGKRVLVTAGATREPVDPVRFLSNHSSGRMGVAVATAAWERGADVTLIAGSLEIAPPGDVRVIRVETTSEMSTAVERELPAADVLVMAAAPSDFRASVPAESKIKRAGAGTATIALTATRDILADTMHLRRPGTVVVGFALETDDLVANAKEKRERKQLDLIVANSASEPDAGFGVDTNRVTLIGRDGSEEAWPVMAKSAVADRLLDHIERLLDGRSRDRLRVYLEQRRDAGERELILDGMSVEDVMRLVGAADLQPSSPPVPQSPPTRTAHSKPPEAQSPARVMAESPPPVVQPPARKPGASREFGEEWRTALGDASSASGSSTPAPPLAAPPPQLAAGLVVGTASVGLFGGPLAELGSLDEIARTVAACTRCPLYRTATNPVPGEGNPNADLVCVGEAPGATEDATGRPFVGQAGQLLTKILAAIQLAREDVFICNVLKHRPPGNRNPVPEEVAACSPYLVRQLELIRPKVIVAFGTFAAQTLLNSSLPLGRLRATVHRYYGIPLIVTYHPAALLRNPAWKRPTWEDVQLARRILDRSAPPLPGA